MAFGVACSNNDLVSIKAMQFCLYHILMEGGLFAIEFVRFQNPKHLLSYIYSGLFLILNSFLWFMITNTEICFIFQLMKNHYSTRI